MRKITLVLIMVFNLCCAQDKECSCKEKVEMNDSTVSCKTVILKNKYKLYWQFNCDKIWLTLEKTNGVKIIINEVPVNLYPYTYRLGFYLVKENKNSLLFRSGCPANGPCNYVLIDKSTGKRISNIIQK